MKIKDIRDGQAEFNIILIIKKLLKKKKFFNNFKEITLNLIKF
jgi:hypothetical protein